MKHTRPGAALRHLALLGLVAAGLPVALTAPTARAGTPLPGAAACPMLPADNVWNTDISSLPVNARSDQWLASTQAATTHLHPDFGPSFGAQPVPYGIPVTVVDGSHPKVAVSFQYAAESDPGPYPFGADTLIEGGSSATGDRHALMVDTSTCTLYELYDAQYSASGSTAGSGAIWDLRSNALRPAGWTSADAAGLPILPGLLRWDEVQSGSVTHAIRFTAAVTDQSYLWPARHQAGSASNPALPPMGARFRLKASFSTAGYLPQTQVILTAMQHYGLILADNGSNWYFSGSADPGWVSNVLDQLKSIPASAFEAVDESSLMVDANSGQVHPGAGQVAIGGPSGPGYRFVAADGGVFDFGGAAYWGSMGGHHLNSPIVGMAATGDTNGYWLVAADGGMFAYGDAGFHGSMGGSRLNSPIVGMAPTPDTNGYWLVAADGGMFAYGDAGFYGSMGGSRLNSPIVGMAPTPDGRGYWLVAADGGVFGFGDAAFAGSGAVGGAAAIAASPVAGGGYWLTTSAGQVAAFGRARSFGALGFTPNRPVIAMVPTPDAQGCWLLGSDGGVFSLESAPFYGSTGALRLNSPVVGMSATH